MTPDPDTSAAAAIPEVVRADEKAEADTARNDRRVQDILSYQLLLASNRGTACTDEGNPSGARLEAELIARLSDLYLALRFGPGDDD
jgi:hypothetical protein